MRVRFYVHGDDVAVILSEWRYGRAGDADTVIERDMPGTLESLTCEKHLMAAAFLAGRRNVPFESSEGSVLRRCYEAGQSAVMKIRFYYLQGLLQVVVGQLSDAAERALSDSTPLGKIEVSSVQTGKREIQRAAYAGYCDGRGWNRHDAPDRAGLSGELKQVYDLAYQAGEAAGEEEKK